MKFFYTIFYFLLFQNLFGQNAGPFRNPSFEISFFPDWIACSLSSSTPDLQPGLWNVSIPPFQGINYMGMVTRGGFCNACNESVSQKLLYPLSQDSCYSFNIMLSYASKGNEGYNDKAILKIWGSNDPLKNCGKEELLWTSGIPSTDDWRINIVQITPNKSYNYITLEVYYSNTQNPNSGHILIDYIHNFKAYPKYLGFNLGNDITICRGEETTLEVQLPASQKNYPFKWSTGETSNKITVKEPGIYWAELKSTCGVFRDSIEIKHEKCIFIPNAFTPNQDGKNETFYIKGINKGNWQLKIYDRRGKLVYENNAYKNDWKGDGLPATLYYYRLTNEENGEDYKGWVQIMK